MDGKTDSLCVLKRSEDGVCGLDSLVFADLGQGIFIPADADADAVKRGVRTIEHERKQYVFNLKRRLLSIGSMPLDISAIKTGLPVLEFDGGFAIANRHYGMFWIFDEQGRFRRRIRLFDQGDDGELCQIKTYWRYEQAVLGCQPTREGNLLVATRSLEAVLFARKDEQLLDDSGQPVNPALFEARKRWSWTDRPNILWWEIDPREGTASKINPPHGAPDIMNESIATSGLAWTYNLDGDPVFSTPKRESGAEPQGGQQPVKPVQPKKSSKG